MKAVACNLFRNKFDRSRENDVMTNRVVRRKYNLPTYLGTGNDNRMVYGVELVVFEKTQTFKDSILSQASFNSSIEGRDNRYICCITAK